MDRKIYFRLIALFLLTLAHTSPAFAAEKIQIGDAGGIYGNVYKDDTGIYIKHEDGSFTLVEGADPATFIFIKIPEEYLEGFVLFAKDKNRVYGGLDLSPLDFADPDNFEVHGIKKHIPGMDETHLFIYGKARGKFWYMGRQGEMIAQEVDADSVQIMEPIVLKRKILEPPTKYHYTDPGVCALIKTDPLPKNHEFHENKDGTCILIVKSENPHYITSLWAGIFLKDKNYLWGYDPRTDQFKKYVGIDAATFTSIFHDVFFKDAKYVYVLKRSKIAFNRLKYDPNSFQIRETRRGEIYIKDNMTPWKKLSRGFRN